MITEKSVDKQKAWGRNPRIIHIEATQKGTKSAMEGRKSKNLKAWISLLDKYNEWIQGVYIRLNTFEEILNEIDLYNCDVLIGVPSKQKTNQYWSRRREEIEDKITEFWSQFHPGIRCESVDVLGTDEITLDHLSNYHRFDADWLSFSKDDEYPVVPLAADLRT